MKKWDYTTISMTRVKDPQTVENTLKVLGDQGWELVSVMGQMGDDGKDSVLVLRREGPKWWESFFGLR